MKTLHYSYVDVSSFFFLQIDDKRLSAMYHGPEENSHVSNYRMVLTNFPLTLEQKKWSKAERENLGKGIRQQFHQLVVQISVDRFRYYILDSVFSIPPFFIMPQNIWQLE